MEILKKKNFLNGHKILKSYKANAVYENKIWLGNLCAQNIARNLCEQNMAQKFMQQNNYA